MSVTLASCTVVWYACGWGRFPMPVQFSLCKSLVGICQSLVEVQLCVLSVWMCVCFISREQQLVQRECLGVCVLCGISKISVCDMIRLFNKWSEYLHKMQALTMNFLKFPFCSILVVFFLVWMHSNPVTFFTNQVAQSSTSVMLHSAVWVPTDDV